MPRTTDKANGFPCRPFADRAGSLSNLTGNGGVRMGMTLGSALNRLVGGLRRHGLSGVGRIVTGVLRRQGLVGTLKTLAGRGPVLAAADDLPDEGRLERAWPPVIDRAGTIPASAWDRWVDRSGPAASPTVAAEGPPIVIVLQPGPAGAAGIERTRQAAAAASLPVVPPEAAPTAPQTLHLYLQAGDTPEPALLDALRRMAADPEVQAITFDLCRREGERVRPLPLPGANLPLLRACDYIFSRAALKAPLIGQTAASPREAILAWCAGRQALLVRKGWRHLAAPPLLQAQISDDDLAARDAVRTAPAPRAALGVSAIICTHNKGHLLRQLVRQLLALGEDQLAEIVLVSNNTSHPHALRTLADLAGQPRIRILHDDAPFNFSRQVNAGVRAARGQGPLLLLNDDIVPVSEDWLAVLAGGLEDPEVGAVGPLLLYSDERVQHGGMYTRFPAGVGHALRGASLPFDDPLGLAAGPREVSCLTGAVLLTTRDAFGRAGGLDENFAISFQDVDYCLKLHDGGLRNLFEPRSILLHMESVSLHNANTDRRLLGRRHAEHQAAVSLWGARFPRDPYLPAIVDPADEGLKRLMRPSPAPRA
jgi:GT2 family glycosyltransferase